jgi:hypothetical protein
MVWSGQAPAEAAEASLVVSRTERRHVAGFMARQFFSRMPKQGRDAIAEATAAGSHTLWTVGPPRSPEAAVMLVEQSGAVGLFNLCVRPDLRRKGLGAGIVRAVQRSAAGLGRPVVLQCEPELAPWYARLGFEPVGTVEALTRSHVESGDILTE